ncbi:MAG: proteasome assembly chaperone family protein [Candidatus Micrarchaeota archaeon]|nr:proteasome assembly chaperone family protein [Candidatus Micrarchaeota archaeon]MDE1824382.1 proteasome assembly chaperone family protein [Candidatus Micrarchaeota archaeon]MDE1849684.1 proteasome assembly chaperone family protein [Candidatus Micrarchaeota archaeon]
MIGVKLFKDTNLSGYTLIEAFPGVGLVGPMAGSYLIEKLKMEYIGYIESDMFPPIASIHFGNPTFPARIYKDDRYKLALVMSEFVIPAHAIYQLAMELLAFVRKSKISRIISISGMPSQKPSEQLFITSLDESIIKKAGKNGIKQIQEGVVAGVSALLLTNAKQFNIPAADILVEVNPTIMDPTYAETAIKGLNKIIDTNIDLKDLEKEAKIVQTKIKDIVKKMRESPEHYDKAAESAGPSMYA